MVSCRSGQNTKIALKVKYHRNLARFRFHHNTYYSQVTSIYDFSAFLYGCIDRQTERQSGEHRDRWRTVPASHSITGAQIINIYLNIFIKLLNSSHVVARRLKIRRNWASLSRKYATSRKNGDKLKKRNDNDEQLSKTLSTFSNKCINDTSSVF